MKPNSRRLARLMSWLLLLVCAPQVAWAGFTNITATPNIVFLSTATQIRVVAEVDNAPGLMPTSVRLLREVGGNWVVVGTMYDDGTNGDQVAGDRRFTLMTTLQATTTAPISLRASVAYSGSVQRVTSSILPVQVAQALDLSLVSGQAVATLLLGQSVSTAFSMNISNQGGGVAKLTAVQSITPSNSGLAVTTDLAAGGYSTSAQQQAFLVQNKFTAIVEGTYTVTLKGTLVAPSGSRQASAALVVRVLPASGIGELALSLYPGGLTEGLTTPVQAGASYTLGSTLPQSVRLEKVTVAGVKLVDLGLMRDDGVSPDLGGNDLIYSARPVLSGSASGAPHYLRAVASFASGATKTSPIVALETFPFPVGFQPIQPASVIADTDGRKVTCNQLLVTFKPGTPIFAVKAIAAFIGGIVLAVEPALNTYQIGLACTTVQGLAALINTLATQPSVAAAGPNGISEPSEMTPNDSLYAQQYSPKLTRADEAWIIARGKGQVVAVLDTGVWAGHPDLSGRVDSGNDYINNDSDPDDDHSHGTHVAGIVAAAGNNGTGIAGVAWESRILAIKVCGGKAGVPNVGKIIGCPDSAVISGIAEAQSKAGTINMSLGGPRSLLEKIAAALGFTSAYEQATLAARAAGTVVVAAAGNSNTDKEHIPCVYSGVFCVGNTTSADSRYADATYGSNYGAQVDIAAPGTSILSTVPTFSSPSGYGLKTGTSMAAPFVAGVVALVRGDNPSWTPAQVEDRLLKTAVPLPGQQIGPRVDVFDAIFNGSFEHDLSGWTSVGTVSAVDKLGPINPVKDKRMAMASTGPDAAITSSDLSRIFVIQPGITEITLSFSYAMITEEYPEWVGRGYNDDMVITLEGAGGSTTVAIETVDGSAFTPIAGIDFPGGDNTVGWTGWRHVVSKKVPVSPGGGVYRLRVRDRGDGIYDTNALVDNIRFR